MKNFFKILAITFVALVVVGSLTSNDTEGIPTAQTKSEATTQSPTRTVEFWQGDGNARATEKKFLEGDYKVDWTTYGDCYYSADLSSGSDIFSAMDFVGDGSTYVYGVPAGNHFVDVITGPSPKCGWFITFRPIG
jgi:hypothetical protein